MVYLKKLSQTESQEIYQMLQEIALNDNGFHNKVYGMSLEQFDEWLAKECAMENGEIEDWMVPQTSYWMYDDEKTVGYGRFRHYLNESLRETGGHIGYAIRKTERGKGYGNQILGLLLEECRKQGLCEVQICANADNIPSNKVIQNNGRVLIRTDQNKDFYTVRL